MILDKLKRIRIKDKRKITLFKVFLFYLGLSLLLTYFFEVTPIIFHFSVFGDESFYAGFITNMYNSILDFLLFSIVIYSLLGKHEKNDKIRLYHDNIDDCRFWYSEEAAFKNAGNIRRLQKLGVFNVDLSKSTLKTTKLKKSTFCNSKFMGACLDKTNFDEADFKETDFQGASIKYSSLNNAKLNKCNFKYAEITDTQMKSLQVEACNFSKAKLCNSDLRATVFKKCDFELAELTGCSLERADLRFATGLTTEQLLTCKSILYAKLNIKLTGDINRINPKLLQNRPRVKHTKY